MQVRRRAPPVAEVAAGRTPVRGHQGTPPDGRGAGSSSRCRRVVVSSFFVASSSPWDERAVDTCVPAVGLGCGVPPARRAAANGRRWMRQHTHL
ncbi:hypothetical protein FRACA_100046 [Frankia canadensis]|uniref:Uncharacterized protein n=1 Tax=Frankia canadensis TaxID=1836972 RepID=A0A2I2KII2_9ACTN|nr:hypothetical protein FRACA_100046 [Frankia canadensis]SOU52768.1 hypothetical protein FRACA_100046 [Frankia canadensis]